MVYCMGRCSNVSFISNSLRELSSKCSIYFLLFGLEIKFYKIMFCFYTNSCMKFSVFKYYFNSATIKLIYKLKICFYSIVKENKSLYDFYDKMHKYAPEKIQNIYVYYLMT